MTDCCCYCRWRLTAALHLYGWELLSSLKVIPTAATDLLCRKIWCSEGEEGTSSLKYIIDFSFLDLAVEFQPATGSFRDLDRWREMMRGEEGSADLAGPAPPAGMFDMKVYCTPLIVLPRAPFTKAIHVSLTPNFCN
jgi:hypothetical protein